MSDAVKVSRKALTELVEKGMKKPQLAEHFGVSQSAMTSLLKEAGLKIRKFHNSKPVLVDDLEEESNNTETVTTEATEAVQAVESEDNTQDQSQEEVAPETQDVNWEV